MKPFLIIIMLLSVRVACSQGMEEMIKSLDSVWATAIMGKDVSQLELLLADDLIYGHASGVLDTKSSYIEKVASGKQIYNSLEQKNIRIRLLGSDAAVSHSWMHVTGTNANGPFDDKVMMLHVWTKRDNSWKLLGHQTAKVDEIPD
jgi:ketosteroid isomerase-like protein